MKKVFLILIAIIGFGINANAQSPEQIANEYAKALSTLDFNKVYALSTPEFAQKLKTGKDSKGWGYKYPTGFFNERKDVFSKLSKLKFEAIFGNPMTINGQTAICGQGYYGRKKEHWEVEGVGSGEYTWKGEFRITLVKKQDKWLIDDVDNVRWFKLD